MSRSQKQTDYEIQKMPFYEKKKVRKQINTGNNEDERDSYHNSRGNYKNIAKDLNKPY